MARGVNKVILIGNVGNDPDVKYTQGGMAVTSFSLATSSVRKNKDGEQVEETQWHRVKAFGKLGELCGEYLAKGKQAYIEGSLRYDKFTGSDGVEKYFTDVVADQVQFLGGGSGGGGGGDSRSGGSSRAPAARGGGERAPAQREAAERPAPRDAAPSTGFADDFADDDIPF